MGNTQQLLGSFDSWELLIIKATSLIFIILFCVVQLRRHLEELLRGSRRKRQGKKK